MPSEDPEPVDPPAEQEHHDDGLDLARAQARSAAGRGGRTPARRSSRGPGSGSGSGSGPGSGSGSGSGSTAGRAPGRAGSSGAHPDDRDPQPLEATLGRLVGEHGWELDLRVHGVFGRWPELVGAEVAQHALPESFAEGTLVVRTDSTAWATQLRLLAPTVVRRLNEELGDGTVTLIEVLGPHGPTWKKGPRSVRDGRGPRDTYG